MRGRRAGGIGHEIQGRLESFFGPVTIKHAANKQPLKVGKGKDDKKKKTGACVCHWG